MLVFSHANQEGFLGLTPHTLSKIFLVQFVSLQIPSSFFIRRALTALKWEVGEAEGVSLFSPVHGAEAGL